MAYAIGAACIDVKDKTCMDVCPVECIYEGGRKLYINPVECIDCGLCVSTCPVDAIRPVEEFDDKDAEYATDNATFFSAKLPGRELPLGNPGGVSRIGTIGLDTPLVSEFRAG
ncbi:MAG TPA: ferredoxin family protein [Acidimicrobiales bacterium]|nr:ferredoxin family protein [Acidimicrobiales bacterium]